MRYSSIDRIRDFEFHDSVLTLVSWDSNCLTVSAESLNVHKDAAPDNEGADMEISKAFITFSDIKIIEFEPSRAWMQDENGKMYTEDPLVVHSCEIARNMFENELKNSIRLTGITPDNGFYELGAIGLDPYFSVRFVFSSVEIGWDDYNGRAWYELHKQCKNQV